MPRPTPPVAITAADLLTQTMRWRADRQKSSTDHQLPPPTLDLSTESSEAESYVAADRTVDYHQQRRTERRAAASSFGEPAYQMIAAMVCSLRGGSIDELTEGIVSVGSSNGRENVHQLVSVAVRTEQTLATRLIQLITVSMATDPSGRSTYLMVLAELTSIFQRPV